MLSKVKFLSVVLVLSLLAGCITAPSNTTNTNPPAIPVVATSVSVPTIVYVTATPDLAQEAAAEETATPFETVITPTPEVTANASISIDSIDDLGGGRAMVHWTSVGDFPSGFIVTWSDTTETPTYPNDTFNYAGDPASRAALITAEVGKIYYLRVCRFVGANCDVYSNLGIFALLKTATATPKVSSGSSSGSSTTEATATPVYSSYNSSGTPIASDTGITISNITTTGTGTAKITWTAKGTFSSGFRILYSTSSTMPYYGGYEFYVISDGTARTAYISGGVGSTYHYRICGIVSGGCTPYSNSYAFTYPGTATSTPVVTATTSATTDPAAIILTSVTDSATGEATVSWVTSGSFPSGYYVMISKTNNLPTTSDTKFTVSSGSATSTTITGDSGSTYYIRACKVVSSACTIYSNVLSFTFANITLTSLTEPNEASAHLVWTKAGQSDAFDNGFLYLISYITETPTYSDSNTQHGAISDGTITTADFTTVPGLTYYFRLCQADSSGQCVAYSNVLSHYFTTSLALSGSSTDSGSGYYDTASLNWSGPSGSPYTYTGYLLYRALGSGTPVAIASVDSSTFSYDDTVTTPGSYTYLLCAYDSSGSVCRGYSNEFPITLATAP